MVFQPHLDLFWNCEKGMLVQKLTFNRYTFGINELVFVKQDLIVIDTARFDTPDIIAVDQMEYPNERFGSTGPQFIVSLIDTETMLWTKDQIFYIVESACLYQNRCKCSRSPHRDLLNLPDFLNTWIAC